MSDRPKGSVPDRIGDCVDLLEELAADRGLLASVDEPMRRRLFIAAGKVSRPDRGSARKLAKAFRRRDKDEKKTADNRLLEATEIRATRRASVFPTPPPELPPVREAPEEELRVARKCYVCKAEFSRLHFFYDQMCAECAELNWNKRNQTADLRGRVALVTGSRVKIGHQAAIMLLRAGARVIVTTRFPRDAAARFAATADFEAFRNRLDIYGLDLRHTPSVEAFCRHVLAAYDRLDFILNNACQTVRRPPGYYAHLMERETEPIAALPEGARGLLGQYESIRVGSRTLGAHDELSSARAAGLHASAALSQVALAPGDEVNDAGIFPAGALDQDLQQIDKRAMNSWRLGLADVPAIELLEVHLVNAVAPFILNARLKSLMTRQKTMDKHIVNVSAMEGQFYRSFKTDKHPHTNMAKAALNMMTRTSASDYVKDGIHMNSVDTGWVTDEDPETIAARKVVEHGFSPPLDIVDGAARIVDPIFSGLNTGEHVWGKFLKDYKPTDW